MEMVWMCHPNLPGQETEVPASAMPIYGMSGWLLMDGPPEPKPDPEVARASVHSEPREEPSDSESMKPKDRKPTDTKESTGAKGSSKSASSAKGSDH
jgi:hypothetical protein